MTALHDTPAFRMHCMKVLPCPQRFAHDWVSCPFAHPGERARRRDPRLFAYTGVACPAIKQDGGCELGDHCPYAHNVFEYWLHPSRYRTQMCSDGSGCHRRICFFAHSVEDLRTPACKPFVRPDAVVAAAAAAAAARKQRQQDGAGTAAASPSPNKGAGQPAQQQQEAEQPPQQEAETPEEEHRRVVETVTWLLGRGEFSPEQAAALLRELLPARALEVLQAGLRLGGGTAGGGGSDWHGAEGARRHSDPFGRQLTHSAGAAQPASTRFSHGSAAAASAAGLSVALAALPFGLSSQQAQQLQAQQQQAQQEQAQQLQAQQLQAQQAAQQAQQGVPDEMANLLARVAAVIQAHRQAAGASPLVPAYAAALGAEGAAGAPRYSAPCPQATYEQATGRMSLDARLEAQLCAGFAVTRLHPQPAPPAGFPFMQQQQALSPGASPCEPWELVAPANSWPCSVGPAELAQQDWQQPAEAYDGQLPSHSWACAPGGNPPQRASLDASLAQHGQQGVDQSTARHSMDTSMAWYSTDASLAQQHGRHSVDARLAQHGMGDASLAQHGRYSVDARLAQLGWPSHDASRARDSMDSSASGYTAGRLSQDVMRRSLDAYTAALSPRPPLPPPAVNPYTSSLFSTAASRLAGPIGGSAGVTPAAPAAAEDWYSQLPRFSSS